MSDVELQRFALLRQRLGATIAAAATDVHLSSLLQRQQLARDKFLQSSQMRNYPMYLPSLGYRCSPVGAAYQQEQLRNPLLNAMFSVEAVTAPTSALVLGLLNARGAFAKVSTGGPTLTSHLAPAAKNGNDELQETSNSSERKRPREDQGNNDDDMSDSSSTKRHQSGRFHDSQWSERFEELRSYKDRTGNTLVPQHSHHENPQLARWVKRQRYQYKGSNMTQDRIKALEGIGFVWDSHSAAWQERMRELKEFKKSYDHCNVPTTYAANKQLAAWVKCQRRQYKLHLEGKDTNMTPERICDLESIEFEWLFRSYRTRGTPIKSLNVSK